MVQVVEIVQLVAVGAQLGDDLIRVRGALVELGELDLGVNEANGAAGEHPLRAFEYQQLGALGVHLEQVDALYLVTQAEIVDRIRLDVDCARRGLVCVERRARGARLRSELASTQLARLNRAVPLRLLIAQRWPCSLGCRAACSITRSKLSGTGSN